MPEGPEIKYFEELLKTKLVGKTVNKIESLSKSKVKLDKKYTVKKVDSKGKLLWLELYDKKTKTTAKASAKATAYLHIHLMLTGWLSFDETQYPKYILDFSKIKLYFDSKRKLSTLKLYKENRHNKEIKDLGIDIFSKDFTLENFKKLIKTNNKKITSFLMDQNDIAGVGNYIKSESLYLAKINPHRKNIKFK